MDLTEDIAPVTSLKRGAAELIARASEGRRPIVITQNGEPTAVLQDAASFQRQRRVLHLLKLAVQGEHDHEAGRVHEVDAVDAMIGERLAEHDHYM